MFAHIIMNKSRQTANWHFDCLHHNQNILHWNSMIHTFNLFRNMNNRMIHTLFINFINGFHAWKWIHIRNTRISITIIIFNHKILFNWKFEIPASLATTRFKIIFTYFVVIFVAVWNWLYVVLYFVLNVVTFDFLLLLTIRCQWFDLFALVRLYLTTVNL